jgi:hypothetical protein
MKVFVYTCLIVFVCSSCNGKGEKQRVQNQFDSVDHSLTKMRDESLTILNLEPLVNDNPIAWGKVKQVDDSLGLFIMGLDTLKNRFTRFLETQEHNFTNGHANEAISSTNKFFIDQHYGYLIVDEMSSLAESLAGDPLTDSSRRRLSKFNPVPSVTMQSPGKQSKPGDPVYTTSIALFQNQPPVAALTILAKFRNDAVTLRSIIFKEYAKLVSSQP